MIRFLALALLSLLGQVSLPSLAGPTSRLDYAQQCAAEMGAIPAFNCLTGQLLPITKNGVAQSQPVPTCDNPSQLKRDCVPYSRLLRIITSNPNVETITICRKYYATPGPNDPNFHDIAIVQHNKTTGNTCFFQTPVGGALNGTVVPSPQAASAAASAYWLEPNGNGPAGIRCTSCHDADPFIWSTYITQVSNTPKGNPLGKWNANFQKLFSTAPKTFKPAANACTACHRIGSETCKAGSFVKHYTTDLKNEATNPTKFWMPPGYSGTAGTWHQTYDSSMQQLDRCCANPGLAECNTQNTTPTLISPRLPPLGEVNVVTRATDKLDLFVTDKNGDIYTAAWQPAFTDWWHGWWKLNGGKAKPGAPVHGASRSLNKLDAFVIGTDSRVYTAAWEPTFTDWWHGWWPLNGGMAAPGAHVTVVSRSKDKLDAFVVGLDGRVYTAAWEPGFTDWWHGWWAIGDIRVPQGAPIHAVARSADKLDIFVTDVNGDVQTAAWEPAFGGTWHGFWKLNGGKAKPGAHVTAVSRGLDKLDVFVVGLDGRVYTAAWQPSFPDWWHGWWPIGNIKVPQGAAVYAVSRNQDKLDIFATDVNGYVQTAAWEPSFGVWHGWWKLNGGKAAPGAPVTAVSRGKDKLDAFVVGLDGRVWTAAWQPSFTDWWHGWWPIGD